MLRATAKPMVGNSNTEGPVWAWSIGRTSIFLTGVYLSGCLCGLDPLRGEGISDWLPTSVPGGIESGLPFEL